MLPSIDFATSVWLVNYYHIIGTISLILNPYTLFLVLFKTDKLDNFKYFLLAFQSSCLMIDVHLTLLMQPQSLYPIPAGFCTGALSRCVSCLSLMTVTAGLMCSQCGLLTLCFFRKFTAILNIQREKVPLPLVVLIFASKPVYVLFFIVYFSLAENSREEMLDIIRNLYPQYESSFRKLDNIAVYKLDIYWQLMLCTIVVFAIWCGTIIFHSTKRIYEILGKFKSKLSASTYRKHKTAIMSLIAQLITSLIGMVPPTALAALLIFEVEYVQVITRVLLVIFSMHASVNAIVLVVTTPPFRKFTMFWKKGYTTFCAEGEKNEASEFQKSEANHC